MSAQLSNGHLSNISTCWSVVQRAHGAAQSQGARHALLDRYGGAVYRYLHGAIRNPSAAEELYQEFALRLLRGDFHRAAPQYGRFRNFVKTALVRLVNRDGERQQARPRTLDIDVADPTRSADEKFQESWRTELLANSWQRLEDFEEETGRPYYRVLRLRVDQLGRSSEDLAAQLSLQLERRVTAAGVRQMLHRAREKFAEILLDQVIQSMADPTPEEVEEELAELELLEYCRPALAL
jgi:RNA polymerase sigma-70 factor (ECF subfamily)